MSAKTGQLQVADAALRSAVERAFTGMADHMVNTDAGHGATANCAGSH